MATENQIRHQLICKIRRIPSNKLMELTDYLNKLDQSVEKPSEVIAFAGCWSTIDDEIFEDFTEKLIDNRKRNTRRFNE